MEIWVVAFSHSVWSQAEQVHLLLPCPPCLFRPQRIRPRCLKEWQVLTSGNHIFSTWNIHQHPSSSFDSKCRGRYTLSDSPYPGGCIPGGRCPGLCPWLTYHHTVSWLSGTPKYRSLFAGFPLPDLRRKNQTSVQHLVSLNDPLLWNVFLGSLKSIFQLSPRGWEVWAAPCVAWGVASFSTAGILHWRRIRCSPTNSWATGWEVQEWSRRQESGVLPGRGLLLARQKDTSQH